MQQAPDEEKVRWLVALNRLEQRGLRPTRTYTSADSIDAIRYECERLQADADAAHTATQHQRLAVLVLLACRIVCDVAPPEPHEKA